MESNMNYQQMELDFAELRTTTLDLLDGLSAPTRSTSMTNVPPMIDDDMDSVSKASIKPLSPSQAAQ